LKPLVSLVSTLARLFGSRYLTSNTLFFKTTRRYVIVGGAVVLW
jgi:hypothetical protein